LLLDITRDSESVLRRIVPAQEFDHDPEFLLRVHVSVIVLVEAAPLDQPPALLIEACGVLIEISYVESDVVDPFAVSVERFLPVRVGSDRLDQLNH
jgi:hypothetical protein